MFDILVQRAFLDVVFYGLELLVLCTARPFGLTLGFVLLSWGRINTGVLRMVLAIALALPVFGGYFSAYMAGAAPHAGEPVYPYLFVLLKELAIGGLLGFILSFPIAIAIGAGHVIDSYRGGLMGDPDPSGGGQITPYAKLFAILVVLLFAVSNGFFILADVLYQTYGVWPLFDPLPGVENFNPEKLIALLSSLMQSVLVISAPLLLVMFVSDLVFLFTARIGKQINVTFLAFSVKNVLALLLLPFFCLMALKIFAAELDFMHEGAQVLRQLFQPLK